MYDRRLDAVVAAAELGSFSQAAQRLHISTPALVKQVSGFEAEHDLTLFRRDHTGVTLTAAGQVIVEEAHSMAQHAEDALRRARFAERDGQTVRMGVSLMSPGRQTLTRWPRIHELEPDLRLELVAVGSLYEPGSTVMQRLGEQIDVVQTSFSTVRWEGLCDLIHVFDAPFYVDVPRTMRLSASQSLSLDDLRGRRVCVLRHANDPMDRLRSALLTHGGIEVADVDTFDLGLFDAAMEQGDVVLTCGAWSGVHPAFAGVSLSWHEEVPTYLAYPRHASPQVERFVAALARTL